jgi:transcriptional regulator with XRE-family HTH domain
MANDICERFRQSVEFLKKNGYVKNASALARRLGVTKSIICEVRNGKRVPTWELLLNFCDAYPINFRWLRKGEGGMVVDDREAVLLKRIAELEAELKKLRE